MVRTRVADPDGDYPDPIKEIKQDPTLEKQDPALETNLDPKHYQRPDPTQ